jgi:hypothetical protein
MLSMMLMVMLVLMLVQMVMLGLMVMVMLVMVIMSVTVTVMVMGKAGQSTSRGTLLSAPRHRSPVTCCGSSRLASSASSTPATSQNTQAIGASPPATMLLQPCC